MPKSSQDLHTNNSEASLILREIAQVELAKRNPFSLIEQGKLWIKTKSGELKPLIPNKAQRYLLNKIKDLWEANKIIRLWVLKARQLGISTIIEAVIYSITSQTENINSLIIADDKDDSSYIFEMSKLYQERCPEHLKPKEKRSNEKKLEFEGTHSQILIDTAENKDAGRNFTFRLVHLSNYAYFPYAKDLMQGLSNSVPTLPRTIVIKETTSKGLNFAKDEWERITKEDTEWTPVFLPWYWDDGYKMEAKDLIIGDNKLDDITIDEPMLYQLITKEGIDDVVERLAWRRWKIINDLGKDIYAFKQEFPSTPEEAFEIIVGRTRFDIKALNKIRRNCENPTIGNLEYRDGFVDFIEQDKGIVEVYRFPDARTKGVTGVDIAEGKGNDRSSASFVNLDTLSEDIVINTNRLDPSEFAKQVWMLGHWTNKSLVAVENNGPGLACILPLRNGQGEYKPYSKLYYKEIFDEELKKNTKKFGWTTNAKTKPLIIDYLAQLIREGLIAIPSESTIKELQTYVIEEDGKMNAVEGCNDDRVMSLAIACMMYKLRPKIDLPQEAPHLEGKVY